MATNTVFNDPIHKTIEIHPLCLKIIDTPVFQRLRYIKQCGVCYLVYPSAVHTRFEHSIGVYYLAGQMLEQLKKKETISEKDCLCVRIAALLHDLGHGPFSHLWEAFVNMKQTENKYHHEQMSGLLFDKLLNDNDKYLYNEFGKYELGDEQIQFIKNIISGDRSKFKGENLFLLEIVANKATNLDVDRWDYMLRDSYFFGVKSSITLDRILTHAEARTGIFNDSNERVTRIAFRDKIERELYETFTIRKKLHEICYQHRVCKNLEVMLLDALCAADDYILGENKKLSQCHRDVTKFIDLNDGLFNTILYSDKTEKAREILKKIQSRKLYEFVGQFVLKNDSKTTEKDLKDIEADLNKSGEWDLRLVLLDLHMGTGTSEPLDNVPLFTKDNKIVYNPKKRTGDRIRNIIVFSAKEIATKTINDKNDIKCKIIQKVKDKNGDEIEEMNTSE